MGNSDTVKGALLMMASMAGFVINDAFMRGVLIDLPLFQSIFLRGLMLTASLGLVAQYKGTLRFKATPADRTRMLWRSGSELAGTFVFLTALTLMPFANISAIMQVIPLAVTLAAALFLGTPIGWRRLTAILVGFLGVLIIVRPGADGFNYASLLVLLAVAIVTIRDLAARTLSPEIPSSLVALHASILLTIVNGLIVVTQGWVAVTTTHMAYLAGAALCLTVGYIASVAAMRIGDLATIAPFRYTSLLWSILLGFVFFSETPDAYTLIGSAIIIAMGVFSFYREHRLRNQHPER